MEPRAGLEPAACRLRNRSDRFAVNRRMTHRIQNPRTYRFDSCTESQEIAGSYKSLATIWRQRPSLKSDRQPASHSVPLLVQGLVEPFRHRLPGLIALLPNC